MTKTNPQHWDETERLRTLEGFGILDTPDEDDFEGIVRMASIVCRAPIAAVNLVDASRHWTKAASGLTAREMPREASLCAAAMEEGELVVVPDLHDAAQPRMKALSNGAGRPRFYAGARIETAGGLPLGMLCVLDHAPRPEGLSDEQREVLRVLARQAMTLIELRRARANSEVLGRELRHRIKNIFAVVGGLVSASSRGFPEAADFVSSLQGRLNALAKAQDFVRPNEDGSGYLGRSATLHSLVRTVLAPYADRDQRLAIAGDDVEVGPGAATPLSLIVHEQATNAMKYGSLAAEDGHLDILTRLEGGTLVLTWTEQGGPRIEAPPQRQGFGSRLAARSAAQLDGEVRYDWAEEGLRLELEIPVHRLAN
ncbi:sensor histidine kinase [Lutibaculum baratangense]|uniref:histidine kinase n=1 Tax=Lutibaculum baratangense AMV1 TaxID=631454 RepID=V4TL52_9HYPH|nr:HWE histidine kinase domain-containing protein [Lutibaculum baratangense]ESR26548.1 putative signal transduction histidine kinase [Lutibaculum baratangense AMV1]